MTALNVALSVDFDGVEKINNNAGAAVSDSPKVGVLLLNLGGPETGDDVEGT